MASYIFKHKLHVINLSICFKVINHATRDFRLELWLFPKLMPRKQVFLLCFKKISLWTITAVRKKKKKEEEEELQYRNYLEFFYSVFVQHKIG